MLGQQNMKNHKDSLSTPTSWSDLVYEGMILKKGKKSKEWKPRWLRLLSTGIAFIFPNQGSPTPSVRLVLRFYTLSAAPSSDYQSAFYLGGRSKEWRSFHLAAPTQESMEKWMVELKEHTYTEPVGNLANSKSARSNTDTTGVKPKVIKQDKEKPKDQVSGETRLSGAWMLTRKVKKVNNSGPSETSVSFPDLQEEAPENAPRNRTVRASTTVTHMDKQTQEKAWEELMSAVEADQTRKTKALSNAPIPSAIDFRKHQENQENERSEEKSEERRERPEIKPETKLDPRKLEEKFKEIAEDSQTKPEEKEKVKSEKEELLYEDEDVNGDLIQVLESIQTGDRRNTNMMLIDDIIDHCAEDPKPSEWTAIPNRGAKLTTPTAALASRSGGSHRDRTPDQIAAIEQREEALKIERLKEKFISKANPYDLYNLQTEGNIGKGSVGEVILAEARDGSGVVAIKKLQTQRRNIDRLPFILREIEIISSSTHPSIVRYIDCFQMGNELWVVMEYMSAGSLYDIIKLYDRGVSFSEGDICYITHEVLVAIEYLHSGHRIHRDIKVDNVLLSLDGSVKLADFGTAVQLTFQRLRRTTLAGTPYYMAPELIQRIPYGEKVDIWSVGISVIELIEGEPPFYELDPNEALEAVLDEDVTISPDVPCTDECRHFINKCCLQRDPKVRWSAKDLINKHPWFQYKETKEVFAGFLHEIYGRTHHDVLKVVDGRLCGPNGEDPGCLIA